MKYNLQKLCCKIMVIFQAFRLIKTHQCGTQKCIIFLAQYFYLNRKHYNTVFYIIRVTFKCQYFRTYFNHAHCGLKCTQSVKFRVTMPRSLESSHLERKKVILLLKYSSRRQLPYGLIYLNYALSSCIIFSFSGR